MSLKVVILGDPSVGKSKLANMFVNNPLAIRVPTEKKMRLPHEVYNKEIRIDGKTWNLEILTGQDNWAYPPDLNKMHCCVLVFDVNNRKSFDNLSHHMDYFAINAYPINAYEFKYVILGNKTDVGRRVVSTEEAMEWCSNNRESLYFDTSANDERTVDLAFDHVIRAAISYFSEEKGPQIYNLQDLMVNDLLGIFFISRERWLNAQEASSILDQVSSLHQYQSLTPNYVKPGLFLTEMSWDQDSDDLLWINDYDVKWKIGERHLNVSFADCPLAEGRTLHRFIYNFKGHHWKLVHFRISEE